MTSSFAVVIGIVATRGRHPARKVNMGHNTHNSFSDEDTLTEPNQTLTILVSYFKGFTFKMVYRGIR